MCVDMWTLGCVQVTAAPLGLLESPGLPLGPNDTISIDFIMDLHPTQSPAMTGCSFALINLLSVYGCYRFRPASPGDRQPNY